MAENPRNIFVMFAHREERPDGVFFDDIFPTRVQTHMCGDEPIVEVSVTITKDETRASHWGWLETGEERPIMIHDKYLLLCVCFMSEFDMKEQIKRGAGNPVRLIVEAANDKA